MTTPLTRRRHDARLDRDVNVARIADALERIADCLADALMPDTREDDDERTQDPGPDDAPASPEDATAWRPVKGGRALLPRLAGPAVEVVVDRLYVSEGVLMAIVVSELGVEYRTRASRLIEPRA